jgi:hypothetical protein
VWGGRLETEPPLRDEVISPRRNLLNYEQNKVLKTGTEYKTVVFLSDIKIPISVQEFKVILIACGYVGYK